MLEHSSPEIPSGCTALFSRMSTGPVAQACYMTHAAYNLLHTVCNMPHILSMIELILLESHRYWTVNLDLAGHHTNYNLTA